MSFWGQTITNSEEKKHGKSKGYLEVNHATLVKGKEVYLKCSVETINFTLCRLTEKNPNIRLQSIFTENVKFYIEGSKNAQVSIVGILRPFENIQPFSGKGWGMNDYMTNGKSSILNIYGIDRHIITDNCETKEKEKTHKISKKDPRVVDVTDIENDKEKLKEKKSKEEKSIIEKSKEEKSIKEKSKEEKSKEEKSIKEKSKEKKSKKEISKKEISEKDKFCNINNNNSESIIKVPDFLKKNEPFGVQANNKKKQSNEFILNEEKKKKNSLNTKDKTTAILENQEKKKNKIKTKEKPLPEIDYINKVKDSEKLEPIKSHGIVGGIKYEIFKTGSGNIASVGKHVRVKYVGRLANNGKVFDSGFLEFTLGSGDMIQGFDLGVRGMLLREQRKVFIPSRLAYGRQQVGGIPANSDLIFDITLTATN